MPRDVTSPREKRTSEDGDGSGGSGSGSIMRAAFRQAAAKPAKYFRLSGYGSALCLFGELRGAFAILLGSATTAARARASLARSLNLSIVRKRPGPAHIHCSLSVPPPRPNGSKTC